jgi:hypothetical protein
MPRIGIGIGLGLFQGGSLDADYQAVLTYATSLGYTLPSSAQQAKQSKLLADLKAGGVWAKLDTFAMFANDGGSNFGLIDWKRLALYTAVNSPTFTTNEGFMGNGTSSYIDTNFNPATQGVYYTLNNASRYYYHFTGAGTTVNDGIASANTYNSIRNGTSTQNFINGITSLPSSFTYSTTKGVKSIHRTSTTDVTLYNDKTGASRITLAAASLTSANQLILRRSIVYGSNEVSAYAMGASLITENDAFVDALNTYINSL